MSMYCYITIYIEKDFPELVKIATRMQLSPVQQEELEVFYLQLIMEFMAISKVHIALNYVAFGKRGHDLTHHILVN